MSNDSSTILCLQTQVGSERMLADSLHAQSVPAHAFFYPTFTRGTYPRRIIKSLFPSYVFAGLELYDRMARLRQLPINLRFHIVGDLDREEIEEIYSYVDAETGYVKLKDRQASWARFNAGDAIEFTGGTFFGQCGVFDAETSDETRVMVLVSLLGRTHRVPYDVRDVQPVSGVYA